MLQFECVRVGKRNNEWCEAADSRQRRVTRSHWRVCAQNHKKQLPVLKEGLSKMSVSASGHRSRKKKIAFHPCTAYETVPATPAHSMKVDRNGQLSLLIAQGEEVISCIIDKEQCQARKCLGQNGEKE